MLENFKEHMLHPKCIFLTGATGYIGAFLLECLLRETHANVFCLVRATNTEEAIERLKSNLTKYHIWDDAFITRINPIVGTLGIPLFGLPDRDFRALATKIDVIYHCGALVNFVYPYSALKGPNVLGTQEVIRLACQGKPKAIHYLSTIDTLTATHLQRPYYEVDLPKQPNIVPDGYPLSKWVAEQMIVTAKMRGVPIAIYRPGWTMSHSQSGASPMNNFLLNALKGFLQLGILPENVHIYDALNVDFVSRAVFHLSQLEWSLGKVFHLWHQHPVPFSSVYEWIHSFGYQFEVVPIATAYELAKQVDISHPLYTLLPELFPWGNESILAEPHPYDHLRNPQIECANLIEGLEGSGIEDMPIHEGSIHQMLSFLVSGGHLDVPPLFSYANNKSVNL